MRAIDADALIKQMEAYAEHTDDIIAKMFTYAFISDVKHAHTIEPERKKGHWLLFGDSYMEFCKCSNCGHSEDTKKNFCPECGADMRGGQDEWFS